MYEWVWDIPLCDGENMIAFTDERKHTYSKGDKYPADGISVSDEHIKYMMGENRFKNVYIAETEKPKQTRKKKTEE